MFHSSHLAGYFGLTDRDVELLLDRATNTFAIRLLHLEAWLHVCLPDGDRDELLCRFRHHVRVEPEGPTKNPGRRQRRIEHSEIRSVRV